MKFEKTMENTTSILEEREKIITAASWQSSFENPEFGDTTYNSFVKVMTYRREVSKRFLQENNEDVLKEIKHVWDHCNNQIKQILGL